MKFPLPKYKKGVQKGEIKVFFRFSCIFLLKDVFFFFLKYVKIAYFNMAFFSSRKLKKTPK